MDRIVDLVSVVGPVRGTHAFLPACLNHLVGQYHKPIELIVVDDGDDLAKTSQIVQKHAPAGRFRRVEVSGFQERRGAPAARNAGAELAVGEFFFFLDSDTYLRPECLAAMIAGLRSAPEAAFAYCEFLRGSTTLGGHRWSLDWLASANIASTMSLVRATDFPPGGFDETLERLQDWDLWLRIARAGRIGHLIPKVLFSTEDRAGISSRGKDDYEFNRDLVRAKHDLDRPGPSKLVPAEGEQAPGRTDVVVLSYGEADRTVECFDALKRTAFRYRLVWVDNGNDHAHRGQVFPAFERHVDRLYLQLEENQGFVGGVNHALRTLAADPERGRFLVLLNNDTTPTTAWLQRLHQALASDPKLGAVNPITDAPSAQGFRNFYRGAARPSVFGQLPQIDFEAMDDEEKARFLWEQNGTRIHASEMIAFFATLFRTEVFEEVGLLDEAFGEGLGDDDDYCHRMAAAGWRTGVVPGVFVSHDHRRTWRTYLTDEEIRGRQAAAREILDEKHPLPSGKLRASVAP